MLHILTNSCEDIQISSFETREIHNIGGVLLLEKRSKECKIQSTPFNMVIWSQGSLIQLSGEYCIKQSFFVKILKEICSEFTVGTSKQVHVSEKISPLILIGSELHEQGMASNGEPWLGSQRNLPSIDSPSITNKIIIENLESNNYYSRPSHMNTK